jgi:hypothetical protein
VSSELEGEGGQRKWCHIHIIYIYTSDYIEGRQKTHVSIQATLVSST